MLEEIVRRATRLYYDVEITARPRGSAAILPPEITISIFKRSMTAQPGYEYVRVFHGRQSSVMTWIENEERVEKQRRENFDIQS